MYVHTFTHPCLPLWPPPKLFLVTPRVLAWHCMLASCFLRWQRVLLLNSYVPTLKPTMCTPCEGRQHDVHQRCTIAFPASPVYESTDFAMCRPDHCSGGCCCWWYGVQMETNHRTTNTLRAYRPYYHQHLSTWALQQPSCPLVSHLTPPSYHRSLLSQTKRKPSVPPIANPNAPYHPSPICWIFVFHVGCLCDAVFVWRVCFSPAGAGSYRCLRCVKKNLLCAAWCENCVPVRVCICTDVGSVLDFDST